MATKRYFDRKGILSQKLESGWDAIRSREYLTKVRKVGMDMRTKYAIKQEDAKRNSSTLAMATLSFLKPIASPEPMSPQQMDEALLRHEHGVAVALHRTKLWSKYAKDVISYVEKRANIEAEYARSLSKLAQSTRPILKEESFLPFQSVYCLALDQDMENSHLILATCNLILGHKFLEPLTARRNEHERCRKQIKDTWQRELKKMQDAEGNLRKSRAQYIQRHQDYEKARDLSQRARDNSTESLDPLKMEKRKRTEEDALQKVMEAETIYKSCVIDANEKFIVLEKVKGEVLQQVRELILQCDQTMKAVTVSYFQLQHNVTAPCPVQFQTMCENSRLYEPGSQHMEFIKRVPIPPAPRQSGAAPFVYEPYSPEQKSTEKDRKQTEISSPIHHHHDHIAHSIVSDSRVDRMNRPSGVSHHPQMRSWPASILMGSDSDSVDSSQSNKSQDTSPTASPQVPLRNIKEYSGDDELDQDQEIFDYDSSPRHPVMSKAAQSHNLRKLKTPSRCKECDSYVYFQGLECSECGLSVHKKCLQVLAIQCGHKRLPPKMTTFGVELSAHVTNTGVTVPQIVTRCIQEINKRGHLIKGIYRVSGVKSRVEKLCQSFENGAELVDLTEVHPNVVSNVLKLYLRQLPEPLLTHRWYPEFVRIAKEYPCKSDDTGYPPACVQELADLVRKLPGPYFATLAALAHHLKRIADHSYENNMPCSNLGIVFGPTLLRTSEGSASLSSLIDTVHQSRAIELLVANAQEIFGNPNEQISHNPSLSPRVNIDKSPVSPRQQVANKGPKGQDDRRPKSTVDTIDGQCSSPVKSSCSSSEPSSPVSPTQSPPEEEPAVRLPPVKSPSSVEIQTENSFLQSLSQTKLVSERVSPLGSPQIPRCQSELGVIPRKRPPVPTPRSPRDSLGSANKIVIHVTAAQSGGDAASQCSVKDETWMDGHSTQRIKCRGQLCQEGGHHNHCHLKIASKESAYCNGTDSMSNSSALVQVKNEPSKDNVDSSAEVPPLDLAEYCDISSVSRVAEILDTDKNPFIDDDLDVQNDQSETEDSDDLLSGAEEIICKKEPKMVVEKEAEILKSILKPTIVSKYSVD